MCHSLCLMICLSDFFHLTQLVRSLSLTVVFCPFLWQWFWLLRLFTLLSWVFLGGFLHNGEISNFFKVGLWLHAFAYFFFRSESSNKLPSPYFCRQFVAKTTSKFLLDSCFHNFLVIIERKSPSSRNERNTRIPISLTFHALEEKIFWEEPTWVKKGNN